MSKLWERYRRNYGLVGSLAGIATLLVALAGVLLQNPKLINPLVKVADDVLPIGASLIRNSAAIVLAFLAGFLLSSVRDLVIAGRKRERDRRTFKSLASTIEHSKGLLLSLGRRPSDETIEEYSSLVVKTYTELEILAYKLGKLSISSPKLSRLHGSNDRHRLTWINYLTRLQGYARDGHLEAAIRLGKFFEPDSEANGDP